MTHPQKTHLKWENCTRTGDLIFSGRITQNDLIHIKLDPIDLKVISSPVETAADQLQSMEILFRRLGEQKKENLL